MNVKQPEAPRFQPEGLDALKRAAETLDDAGYEILAEQVWYAYEANGGER